MTAASVLADLTAHGAVVWLSPDGTLAVDAPRGVLTEDRRAAIRQHKAELVVLLRAEERIALLNAPCPAGGRHNWLVRTPRGSLCTRCNTSVPDGPRARVSDYSRSGDSVMTSAERVPPVFHRAVVPCGTTHNWYVPLKGMRAGTYRRCQRCGVEASLDQPDAPYAAEDQP